MTALKDLDVNDKFKFVGKKEIFKVFQKGIFGIQYENLKGTKFYDKDYNCPSYYFEVEIVED